MPLTRVHTTCLSRARGKRRLAPRSRTHELHAAERHADRVIVLSGGKIVFSGTADELRARGGDHADLDLAFARVVAG